MTRGIVRKIDELGRVSLPIEIRRTFGLEKCAPIGIYQADGVIHLMKADEKFRGIARELDEPGRLTLPIEVRRTLGFVDHQKVDIYVDEDEICIKKDGEYCAICGRTGELFNLYKVKEARICKNCALAVHDLVEEGLD